MPNERPPAIAGTFYPGDGAELDALVARLLSDASPAAEGAEAPKALIAPHAGYPYSGAVAATAYARLASARDRIRRVVLVGPSHFVPFRGLAVSSAAAFRTPLGTVPVDAEGVRTALAHPGTQTLDLAHAREHSLEAHLPFLQGVLGEFTLVPLVVGNVDDERVGRILQDLWGGPETLVVVSSDLSHFLDDASARDRDAETARAIEEQEAERLTPEHACGVRPLRGLLWHAADTGARIRTLDLRNSGDAGAPPDRVVGYGAFALEEAH
ncbi:MAG: AmmeMemoRadiSam system protein B [Thiohalorhabdus sp.]|uniref:AmmeMemoRadiSam system protein B n=1 Tax=Thiohalorhabdus sp. TaxID=3094134 RepID=UPI00397E9663